MRINLSQKRKPNKSHRQSSEGLRSIGWLVFVILLMALSGCGNKGDLYMPEKDDSKKSESTEGVSQSKP